jgi:hypothetical protein
MRNDARKERKKERKKEGKKRGIVSKNVPIQIYCRQAPIILPYSLNT